MPEWRGRVVPDEALTDGVVTALQDRVLASMDGLGDLDQVTLRELPAGRATALARIAYRTGDMSREDRDALVKEATLAGAAGRLRPLADERRLRASGSKRRA
jgi:hypothetical protein